jgi:3,5-dioxohexanoate:acetyl-CoA acetone transferase
MKKLIVTVALTGGITQKGTGKGCTPYLTITADEMAEETRRCVEAGASIVHIHARDPQTGAVTSDLKIFQEIVEKVRAKCDAIVCLTTGGGLDQTLEERLAVVPHIKPEIASYTGGLILYGMYNRVDKRWLLDMAPPLKYHDMEEFARVMGENGVIPEIEIYSASHLENIKRVMETGYLKPPLHFQIVMGMPGQITASTPHNLMHIADTIRREFPSDSVWGCCAVGGQQWPICTMAAILGADGVRTGMEDNIYIERGELATSNAQLVEKLVGLCRGVGREIASVDDARQIWGIPSI